MPTRDEILRDYDKPLELTVRPPVDPEIAKETPTAPALNNTVAGIMKGWSTDLAGIAGLGAALFDYAYEVGKGIVTGEEREGFAESFYTDGGMDRVKQHLQGYAQQLKQNNPEWSSEKIKEEVEKYRATDDFFRVNTGEMKAPLRASLMGAWQINKSTGVDKRPDQETFLDGVEQTVASIVTPLPFVGKIAGYAGRALGKWAETGIKIADYTVLPGTHLGDGYATRAAVGSGLGVAAEEVVRDISGGSSLLNGSITGDNPPIPTPEQMPSGVLLSTPAAPSDSIILPRPEDGGPSTGQIAAGAGAIAAGALGLKALRGRFKPDANIDFGGPTIREQIDANRLASGLAPEQFERSATAPLAPELRAIGETVARDAPIDNLARDLGGESLVREVQAQSGLVREPAAVNRFFQSWFSERGGDRLGRAATELAEDELEAFTRMNLSRVELARRTDQMNDAMNALTNAKPGTKDFLDAQARVNALNVEAPETRHAFRELSKLDLQRRIIDGESNPKVKALEKVLEQENEKLIRMGEQAGTITPAQAIEMRKRPWHSSIWEHDPKGKASLDADVSRNFDFVPGQPGIAVNKSIDPVSSFYMRAAATIADARTTIGKRNTIEKLVAADPTGAEVRDLGFSAKYGQSGFPKGGAIVEVPDAQGRMKAYQFAKPAVADAFKIEALRLGQMNTWANRFRKGFQFGTTNVKLPIINSMQAPVTLLYDIGVGYMAKPQGRSLGYAGEWLRRIGPDRGAWARIVDIADTADVTQLASVAGQIMTGPLWRATAIAGKNLMQATAQQNGFLGSIAKNVPGAQQFMNNIGAFGYRQFEASALGVARKHNGADMHGMIKDAYGARMQYERGMEITKSLGQGPAYRAARTMMDGYLALMDSVSSANQMSYIARNMGVARSKYTGAALERETMKIVEEARRLAGDMQAVPKQGESPANRAMITYGAHVPYGNIFAQSARAIANSALHDPTFAARIGAIMAGGYLSHKFLEDSGAKSWYYDTLNDFQRLGVLHVPTPENIMHYAQNGKWMDHDPDNPNAGKIAVRIPPEMAIFNRVFDAFAEGFGLINRGENKGGTGPFMDMAKAAANMTGLGGTPLLNVGSLALIGGTVDPAKSFGIGRGGAVSPAPAPRGMGVNEGNLSSNIPAIHAQLFRSVTGLVGDLIISTANSGLTSLRVDQNLNNAMKAGADELEYKLKERVTPNTTVPGLYPNAPEKVYMRTPTIDYVDDSIKQAKVLDKQWQIEFSKNNRYENTFELRDEDVSDMVNHVHKKLMRGSYVKTAKEVTELRAEIADIQNAPHKYPPEKREELRRQKMRELRTVYNDLHQDVKDLEEDLKEDFPHVWAREKLDPTIANAVKLAQKYTR